MYGTEPILEKRRKIYSRKDYIEDKNERIQRGKEVTCQNIEMFVLIVERNIYVGAKNIFSDITETEVKILLFNLNF